MKRRRSVSSSGLPPPRLMREMTKSRSARSRISATVLPLTAALTILDGKTPGRQVFLRVRILPGGGLFAFHVDAQQVAKPDQREDGSHDAQRVGHGVPVAMSGASAPACMSLKACCAAPSPGVLVTAPDITPTIVVMDKPVM